VPIQTRGGGRREKGDKKISPAPWLERICVFGPRKVVSVDQKGAPREGHNVKPGGAGSGGGGVRAKKKEVFPIF